MKCRSSRSEVLCKKVCNFKSLWHRCFPVNFAKFLRTLLFIEHLMWLLLEMERAVRFTKLVIIRIRSILNIKLIDIAQSLNDADCERFWNQNDPRSDFLLKMTKMFKQMYLNHPAQRMEERKRETVKPYIENRMELLILLLISMEQVLTSTWLQCVKIYSKSDIQSE